MMKRSLAVALIAACATLSAQGQSKIVQPTLTPQDSGTTNGLIAVSPVNPQVVWASGRCGHVRRDHRWRTTRGGPAWCRAPKRCSSATCEGVSAKVAYLQSIGNNPTDFRIYKTVDGGATWTMQFQNQNPAAFYDCFAFWTPKRASRTATR